jgi:hypothetical protein
LGSGESSKNAAIATGKRLHGATVVESFHLNGAIALACQQHTDLGKDLRMDFQVLFDLERLGRYDATKSTLPL